MFDVQQRDVPEQLVLMEQRNVGTAELPGFLRMAMGRLDKIAREYGGLAGPWFVVYHGQIADDSEFPRIQSVYAGVERWIRSQRLEIADAPREAYVADFFSAGPGDQVCDVAVPIMPAPG